jgi:hypothetical protein
MFGAGIMLRILTRSGGRILDRWGILPHRFYLRDALEALEQDDLSQVVRMLRRGRNGDPVKWDLIRQQAIFRCRLLREKHERSLQRLQRFQDEVFDRGVKHRDLIALHSKAIRILANHESALLNLPEEEN